MEGFMINIIATVGSSGLFLMVFFSIYYLCLKGTGEEDKVKDKNKSKDKRLGKGFLNEW